MATVVIGLDYTQGNTWVVPPDCYGTVQVEAIGPGGGGGGSNGGGAYTKTNLTLTAGQTVYLNWVDSTWMNISTNAAPTSTAQGILAAGGRSGLNTTASQGLAANCIPSTGAYSGGKGDARGYACGGAAGPNGAGGDVPSSTSGGYGNEGGPGGSANGGTGSYGGTGSNISGTSGQTAGSMSLIYTDYLGKQFGPAGGSGGGGSYSQGKSSGTTLTLNSPYGGGGYQGNTYGTGKGYNGLIVITFTPQLPSQGKYLHVFSTTGTSNLRVPFGVNAAKVECLGPGASSYLYLYYNNINPGNGNFTFYTSYAGGGGAYASSILKINTGDVLYINVPSVSSSTNNRTWVNKTNAVPTSINNGVLAEGALPFIQSFSSSNAIVPIYSLGGQASNSIGQITYSGGNGGTTYSLADSVFYQDYKMGGAGGGGCAGPNGPGGNGASGYYLSTSTGITGSAGTGAGGGSGGGGAANGGGNAAQVTGKAGSNGGASRTGTAGGVGVTYDSSIPAGVGSNGSGGGGASYYYTATPLNQTTGTPPTYYVTALANTKGGAGSTDVITEWNPTGSTTFGPGSGSGGAGRIRNYATGTGSYQFSYDNNYTSLAAAPGKYGGGGGTGTTSWSSTANTYYNAYNGLVVVGDTTMNPKGGQGLAVVQYFVTKTPNHQMFI